MKKMFYTILAVSLLGSMGFAGSLEQAKNDGGLKFSEADIKGEAPAVQMNGEFRSAPKAQATALPANKAKFRVPALKSAGNTAAVQVKDKKGWRTAKITGAVVGGLAAGGAILAVAALDAGAAAVAPVVIVVGVGALAGYGLVAGGQWIYNHVSKR